MNKRHMIAQRDARIAALETRGAQITWDFRQIKCDGITVEYDENATPPGSSLEKYLFGEYYYGSVDGIALRGVKIDREIITLLKSFKNLEALSLPNTNISSEHLRELACLRSLRSLNLAGTNIDDSGLAVLSKLTEIEVLFLWGTSVTDNSVNAIKELEHLRYVNLQYTPVTDDAARQLKADKPNCSVSFEEGD